MIYVERGKERDGFIAFIEKAIGILSTGDYNSFLSLFDSSRLSEQDLILALKYLDETRPVLKIDNPSLAKSDCQDVYLCPFRDGSGYSMDYDLRTNGERNDLTVQIDFLIRENGYVVVLDDLHTL